MNVSFNLDPATIGLPNRASPPSECDLDCKEKLFSGLADQTRLRILDALCEGAKTVEQIAAATGSTLTNVAIQLERLADCGLVRPKRIAHSLLYTLNPPVFLQLEAVADEFLEASFKALEVTNENAPVSDAGNM